MIRELNTNQVALVSGGKSLREAFNSFAAGAIGGAIGAAVENRYVAAAGRVALSAVRGAPMGGVPGVVIGAAIGVLVEIAISSTSGG